MPMSKRDSFWPMPVGSWRRLTFEAGTPFDPVS